MYQVLILKQENLWTIHEFENGSIRHLHGQVVGFKTVTTQGRYALIQHLEGIIQQEGMHRSYHDGDVWFGNFTSPPWR